MIVAFLIAVAAPTAVDAEYAFARDAQAIGQWTAFRKYADPSAVMFTPQAVWAHHFLAGRVDPVAAVKWKPAISYLSCDGRVAVNTGPWERDGGNSVGLFTTVWWQRDGEWRWTYDGGTTLARAWEIGDRPYVRKASCDGQAISAPLLGPPPALTAGPTPPSDYGRGESADRTLGWDWKVEPDGTRTFRMFLWNGTHFEQLLHQVTPPQ